MDYYYLKQCPEISGTEKQSKVHREGCTQINDSSNSIYLGHFSSCRDATDHARRIYPYVAECCCDCCPESKGLIYL